MQRLNTEIQKYPPPSQHVFFFFFSPSNPSVSKIFDINYILLVTIRSYSYELYGCVCEYCDKLFSLGDKCFNKYNNCTKTTFAIHVFQREKFFIILKLNLCGCNNFI